MSLALSRNDLDKITDQELRLLINHGMLNVVIPSHITLMPTKEDYPEYKKNAHLKGTGISISAASRKYNISHTTILGWIKQGIIKRIGKEKNRVLIDEADMAYCAEIAKQNPGAGKWLFNPDGTPYQKKIS